MSTELYHKESAFFILMELSDEFMRIMQVYGYNTYVVFGVQDQGSFMFHLVWCNEVPHLYHLTSAIEGLSGYLPMDWSLQLHLPKRYAEQTPERLLPQV